MKTAIANWTVELDAECPHCEHLNNLMLVDEYWIVFGNVESKENVNREHKCESCGEQFLITESSF